MSTRWTARLFALFVILAFGSSAAHAFDGIVVFGDSYNDVGNIYLATSAAGSPYPGAPYYNGRFSNGPIWIEHIANDWGFPLKPSLAGGTDYAFGGAEMLQPVVTPSGTIPSVPQQVGLYLLAHGGKADPHTLYVIEGGGNDILNASGGSASVLGEEIAAGISGIEVVLRQAGAKNFLIPDLLDVSELPAAAADKPFAANATVATNLALDSLLANDIALEGIGIYRLNVFQTFRAVGRERTHFGFNDVTTPCINPATSAVCSDPAHSLWWDAEHPTEFGHAFFAILVESRMSNR